ncbi:MAG: hypothetical protein LBL74_08420 [Bacteroidales bacterium]|jgi:hypothetical protein|nr:hypothetical protein [Bacteroidales bacterium]
MKRNLIPFKQNLIPLLVCLLLLFASCDNFEGDQQIPAYIKVKGFNLVDNPALSYNQNTGFLTSDIADVWVTANSDTATAYQLRNGDWLIPILHKGNTRIVLQAGVLLNGIRGTRIPYPFYTPEVLNIDLTEGEITDLDVVDIKYDADLTVVPFYEDFEDSYLDMITASPDTIQHLFKITDSVCSESFAGAMYMNASDVEYKVVSKDSINYTNTSLGGIYLELDYNCNIPLNIGLYGKHVTSNQYLYMPAIRLNPNEAEGYKKIYMNLTKAWDQLGQPPYFKLYFQPANPNKLNNGWIHLDNIKIVHFPN